MEIRGKKKRKKRFVLSFTTGVSKDIFISNFFFTPVLKFKPLSVG